MQEIKEVELRSRREKFICNKTYNPVCYCDENLFLFPNFFNINLFYMFKFIQLVKNWNDACVRGLEISH